MAKLKEKLAADPWVRGDPSRFTDHLSFLTMQNESKFGREKHFQAAREYLNAFPVGTVSIFGPATADFGGQILLARRPMRSGTGFLKLMSVSSRRAMCIPGCEALRLWAIWN